MKIRYNEARQMLIDFIDASVSGMVIDAEFNGADLVVKWNGIRFTFFLDAPGDGSDLDYLDKIETEYAEGEFCDWWAESDMNPIDDLPDGALERLKDILTIIYHEVTP